MTCWYLLRLFTDVLHRFWSTTFLLLNCTTHSYCSLYAHTHTNHFPNCFIDCMKLNYSQSYADYCQLCKNPGPIFHSSTVLSSNVQSIWNSFPLTISITCYTRLCIALCPKQTFHTKEIFVQRAKKQIQLLQSIFLFVVFQLYECSPILALAHPRTPLERRLFP